MEIRYWLVEILIQKQEWEQARIYCTQLYTADNAEIRGAAHYWGGMIAVNLNDIATARQLLNQVISEYPGSIFAGKARQQLAELSAQN